MKNAMNEMLLKYVAGLMAVNVCAMALAGCSTDSASGADSTGTSAVSAVSTLTETNEADTSDTNTNDTAVVTTNLNTSISGGQYSADDLFTDRDLAQTADLSDATYYTVKDGQDITVTKAGVYVLSGTASDVTVTVNAGSDDKVQLVLDGVSITNADFPCIYVKQADKVFVTTTNTDNSLSVTGSFTADSDTNTDGAIFSKDDLVLNGVGTLTVSSTDNGVVCKDDLKVTGGTYVVTASSKAFEANDSIRIADGTFTLKAGTDGLHAENEEDGTLGYVYIAGGSFEIQAGDDGIHATSVVQIDGGSFNISAAEGIEGTYVQINGGTVNVTGQSSFDYDGTATFTGGTVIVNGQQVDTLPNQMMGGGFGGQGQMGGYGGGRGRR